MPPLAASILFHAIGAIFQEWKACRRRTHATLALAISLLIIGKLLLDYGNYLGTQATQ